MAKVPLTPIGRARTAAKAVVPLALSAKKWWDGLSEKERQRYKEQAYKAAQQAQKAGKAGLDRAKAVGGSAAKRGKKR